MLLGGLMVFTSRLQSVSVFQIQALYSPLHRDKGAAARSLARVFMALIRHCTGVPDATIQVDDYPLALDLSPVSRAHRWSLEAHRYIV